MINDLRSPQPALEGQLILRRSRRRNDLMSLRGACREHAAVIRKIKAAINEQRPVPMALEVLSRCLGRHTAALKELTEVETAQAIEQQLARLQAGPVPRVALDATVVAGAERQS